MDPVRHDEVEAAKAYYEAMEAQTDRARFCAQCGHLRERCGCGCGYCCTCGCQDRFKRASSCRSPIRFPGREPRTD